MVKETIDGIFRQTNLPNESEEYLRKREELRLAEVALMQQQERVAELRRQLPLGAAVQDYDFEEGPANRRRAQGGAAARGSGAQLFRACGRRGDFAAAVERAGAAV